MKRTMSQSGRGRLVRVGRRIVAVVAECNYAQTQLISLRSTPERF
jgi:hypothetical protein